MTWSSGVANDRIPWTKVDCEASRSEPLHSISSRTNGAEYRNRTPSAEWCKWRFVHESSTIKKNNTKFTRSIQKKSIKINSR